MPIQRQPGRSVSSPDHHTRKAALTECLHGRRTVVGRGRHAEQEDRPAAFWPNRGSRTVKGPPFRPSAPDPSRHWHQRDLANGRSPTSRPGLNPGRENRHGAPATTSARPPPGPSARPRLSSGGITGPRSPWRRYIRARPGSHTVCLQNGPCRSIPTCGSGQPAPAD